MKRKILAGLTMPLALLVLWVGAWMAKDINAGDWKFIPAFVTLWIFIVISLFFTVALNIWAWDN